ncbi:MAG: DUF2497 domain-containing protein [Hyphomicrobiales bacterium]
MAAAENPLPRRHRPDDGRGLPAPGRFDLTRATGDRSIEDMTKELLRGMLKQWLDENLPALVESLVREEIRALVARRGR